jgi:hypothetical protein
MGQRTPLKRLRAYVEPYGSYAIDGTGTIANFADLRIRTAAMNRGQVVLPDTSMVQRVHQRYVPQHGFKSVLVDFSGPLVSTDEALEDGVTATKDVVSKVIEAMIGGYATNEGSLVASGASTTGITVTGTEGSRFPPGTIIAVESATAGRYEITKVKTQSTDALTFATALSFSPSVGAKVLNAQLLYPTQIPVTSATSIQLLCEGEDRDLIWLGMGCQGKFALTWALGQEAMWSTQFQGSQWLHDDELATPQGGASLAVATLSGSAPIPITAGSMILTPISGTARTLPTISEVTLDTGYSWQPVPSYNGVQGVAQMALVRGEQPTLSMRILAVDESWDDVFEAKTKYQFLAQGGVLGGKILGLECGTMVLGARPTFEEQNGLDYWRLTWNLLEDENCDNGSSDIERAFFRLARL